MGNMTAEIIVFCVAGITIAVLWARKDYTQKMWVKCVLGLAFAIYIAAIAHYTLLHRDISSNMRYELSLFWSYEAVKETANDALWWEIVNNIVLFVPMGVLVPVLLPSFRSSWKIALCALGCSAVVEVCQLVFRLGLFEFDDIFNNTWGALMGYGIFRIGYGIWKRPKGWRRMSACWMLGIVGAVAYFLMIRMKFVH